MINHRGMHAVTDYFARDFIKHKSTSNMAQTCYSTCARGLFRICKASTCVCVCEYVCNGPSENNYNKQAQQAAGTRDPSRASPYHQGTGCWPTRSNGTCPAWLRTRWLQSRRSASLCCPGTPWCIRPRTLCTPPAGTPSAWPRGSCS